MDDNIKNKFINLYIQLDHINSNNKYDDNYEYQISYVEKQIADLEKREELYRDQSGIINNKNMKIYRYKGPIYSFDNYICESELIETSAISRMKAKSNFIFRLKEKLNLSPNTNLQIDEQKIKEVI